MTEEQRRYQRYDILAQMRVKQDDNNYILTVENISRSGIFVSTEPSDDFPGFALDQELEMTLFTIEGLENIRTVGHIVRLTYGDAGELGYGIEFSFMTEAARKPVNSGR